MHGYADAFVIELKILQNGSVEWSVRVVKKTRTIAEQDETFSQTCSSLDETLATIRAIVARLAYLPFAADHLLKAPHG
jgi:hypothetical protein